MDVKEAGRLGGKKAAENMTAEQKLQRSRNATKALREARAKKRAKTHSSALQQAEGPIGDVYVPGNKEFGDAHTITGHDGKYTPTVSLDLIDEAHSFPSE